MATCTRRLLLVLLHSLTTAHALRVAPTRPLSRRTLLAGLATAASPSAALAVSTASFTEAASATDLAQVLKSYTTLGISLDEWPIETTLMQIGRPTQLQRAVDQLPEETLKRLAGKSYPLQASDNTSQCNSSRTFVPTGPRHTALIRKRPTRRRSKSRHCARCARAALPSSTSRAARLSTRARRSASSTWPTSRRRWWTRGRRCVPHTATHGHTRPHMAALHAV